LTEAPLCLFSPLSPAYASMLPLTNCVSHMSLSLSLSTSTLALPSSSSPSSSLSTQRHVRPTTNMTFYGSFMLATCHGKVNCHTKTTSSPLSPRKKRPSTNTTMTSGKHERQRGVKHIILCSIFMRIHPNP